MDLYFARHDGNAATIEDFLTCFEEASGRDLSHFKLWYGQAGTPELVCALSWDRASKTAELRIEQINPATPGEPKKKPLHIPVRLGLVAGNGQDLPLLLADGSEVPDSVLHVTKRSQTFRFRDVPSRPVPSVLRGFSAPVNLTIDHTDRDLEFLIANDSDLFNRWQAANSYATRMLIQAVRSLAEGKRSQRGLAYARALAASIADETLDPAYRAEMLRLPTESDIAREIGRDVDPDHIHRARRHLLRLIGTQLGDALAELYARMSDRKAFSPSPAAAGRRALRNAALTLLVARGEDADHTRLREHYFKARNMTDAAHALFLLAAQPKDEGAEALAHFHDRWKGDHLVIDTWFSAQAASPQPTTLEQVHSLLAHPLFQLTTPNKARALVGTFAMANPVQFNRPDGAGYAFVAAKVLEIDAFNPQVAARLLNAFRSWRALEPGRRKLARRALQTVQKSEGLSRDVYEIVSKTLDAP
jgi:aminopeptidase N